MNHEAPSNQSTSPPAPVRSHIMSVRMLLGVWGFLCLMALLNAFLGGVSLGQADVPVALAIASAMAVVSALYFMHLRYDHLFNVAVLLLTLLFITLFISFSLTDTMAYRSQFIPGEAPGMVKALQHEASPAPARRPSAPQ